MSQTVEQIIEEFADAFKEEGYIDFDGVDIIEEGDWISEHKYEYCTSYVRYKNVLIGIDQSRSGSYYSDYHYNDTYFYQVKEQSEVKVIKTYQKVGKPISRASY